MNKNAAIYVRVSSEHQGEKSSPVEQEADCRKLAEEKGLNVVRVYRDVEKYRSKNKLVEPSGTRYDRPGLLAILKDAEKGDFDTILAWREDRLYRGMRSMLMVLESIQENKISIMLARENFDPKIAPLRAWVAQMELDGMKERMTMGVKARLRAGKANTGKDRYGYKRNGEVIEIVEDEAFWVRKIFAWYVDGIPMMQIRNLLIAANAPQKGSTMPRRIQWARSSIQAILIAAKEYAFGIKVQSRKGDAFEIPVQPIIDNVTYERFLIQRKKKKTHSVSNIKYDYLIGGKLYCDCNIKWGGRTNKSKRNRKGVLIRRKTPVRVYYCGQIHKESISPNCPRHIGTVKADEIVWQKVCDAIERPEYLLGQAKNLVAQMRNGTTALEEERARIKKQIKELMEERQWVITRARKARLTTSDLDNQLSQVTLQEIALKRELSSLGPVIDIQSLDNWDLKVADYLTDLQVGIEELKTMTAPQNEEERHEIYLLKKKVVDTLVERVDIDKDRNLHVHIRLNLLDIIKNDSEPGSSGGVQVGRDGIYTRILLILAHPHHFSSCG